MSYRNIKQVPIRAGTSEVGEEGRAVWHEGAHRAFGVPTTGLAVFVNAGIRKQVVHDEKLRMRPRGPPKVRQDSVTCYCSANDDGMTWLTRGRFRLANCATRRGEGTHLGR